MHIGISITPKQLTELLLSVSTARPVFIWGAPGIGKSSLVEKFAESVGMPCVSLLGSQLAPEDLIGVPQIVGDVSRFCPPASIARKEPYCLFLDELNACTHEVQKAFYSLINEKRIGEYTMPPGSIVIGAGNRAADSAIVRTMSSALINRMLHVQLRASHRDWLEWAGENQIHPYILEYLKIRPDHLFSQPPKTQEPFSTPRSWHILSDCLSRYGQDPDIEAIGLLAQGSLSPHHATQFKAFVKQIRNRYKLSSIIDGDERWPEDPEDRDVLYFLAQSFKARLIKELPLNRDKMRPEAKDLAFKAKNLLKELARISLEIAQMTVSQEDDGQGLPDWFVVEIVRDLPRLAVKKA
jgi:hypothetical protein